MAAPERSHGLAGSIVKGRYRVKAIASVRPDVVLYRAEDVRSGRPIVLEVLRDELAADTAFVAAVREQAWTLAKSAHIHRGVVRVYDCGTTDTGDVFVALEPTTGPTLREVIDTRRPLHPGTALRIASEVGEALETLHHAGIVHGYLDPESVLMVTDDKGAEHVALVGVELTAAYRTPLGRRLHEASPPPYLAPEQTERGETMEAADIYALGMLLREMLVPDKAGPTGVPPTIARIIATAVDPRPRHRYSDISVMINDMWGAQTAFPEPDSTSHVVKPPTEGGTDAQRRVRGGRPGVTLGVALVAALVIIAAALVWAALSERIVPRFRARATPPAATAPAATVVPVDKLVTPEPHPAPAIAPQQPLATPAIAPRQPSTAPALAPQAPTPATAVVPQAPTPAPAVVPQAPGVAPQPPAPAPAVAPQAPPAAIVRQPPSPAPTNLRQPPAVAPQPSAAAGGSPSARSLEPRSSAERPTAARPSPERPVASSPPRRDPGDGSAIIDWLLKNQR